MMRSSTLIFILASFITQCKTWQLKSGRTAMYGRTNKPLYRVGTSALKLQLDPTILPAFKNAVVVNGLQAAALACIPKLPLTPGGLLHATILGTGLWTFLGVEGWLIGVVYLITGSIVTKIKMKDKEMRGIAEKRGGARGPENVWGSAATAMICALLTYFLPHYSAMLKVGFVASLATKLSDTFASEIGKAYGRNTYLITTLKMVPRGTEGAVSVEGTLAGVVGSVLITLLGSTLGQISGVTAFVSCIIAAFLANAAESYIGATFQDDIPWLTNELVNLINTLIGALIAMTVYSVF
jgi:uncharacterized protein (TIGR00297 family)